LALTGLSSGTVNVNVLPTTAVAIAFSDAYNAIAGQQLNVTAPGPLANEASAGTTTMIVDDSTDHGILTPVADGSFTYQPNPGYSGPDSFVYHAVSDSLGSSNAVTVTITVTSPTSLVVINTRRRGAGSLRQALTTAQIEPGALISFNIAGAGPHTISAGSALTAITQPTTIDGYSQPGSSPNTAAVGTNAVIKIELRGAAGIPGGTSGLLVQNLYNLSNAGIKQPNNGINFHQVRLQYHF
jgi:hypothetical protein